MAAAPAARAASYCGGPRIWSLAEGYLGEPASQLHEWAFTESYAREWRCLAALCRMKLVGAAAASDP